MIVARRASRALLAVVFAAIAYPSSAQPAQDAANAQALRSEIDQLKQDFNARLSALESRLSTLEGGAAQPPGAATGVPSVAVPAAPPGGADAQAGNQPTAPVPAGAEGGGGPAGALPVYGNASAGSKVFNPDMAVIGNFIGAAGKNTVAPLPALALPESELSLQAVVDPYARADFFLSFGEEGVAVEEGYLTFPALPGGLLMKVGRQYARHSARRTPSTRTSCRGPIVRWSPTNLLGGDEPLATPVSRWRG